MLTNRDVKEYRGDHLLAQTDFFDLEGDYKIDFLGRFENLQQDLKKLNKQFSFSSPFEHHAKKNDKRLNHYSLFYTTNRRKLVERNYEKDLSALNYSFEDQKKGFQKLKNLLL